MFLEINVQEQLIIAYMERIEEKTINNIEIYGKQPKQVLAKLKRLVDIMYGNISSQNRL